MRILPVLLFFFWSATALAGEPEWYYGEFVHKSGFVFRGRIRIDSKLDLVFAAHDTDDLVDVFSAAKVSYVSFYDNIQGRIRKFISKVNTEEVYPVYQFYEIVLEGELSVLRRTERVYVDERYHEFYAYYVSGNQSLVQLRKFRSRVFPALRHRVPTLRHHIRKSNLRFDNTEDVISMIRYCNSYSSAPPMAVESTH